MDSAWKSFTGDPIFKELIMTENEIATKILDAAFALHRHLGPGISKCL